LVLVLRATATDQVIRGFDTPTVSRISGVPRSTLDYWALNGVVTPSLRSSSGPRATRWWSLTDLVVVRAVRSLRAAGCPLQTLRRAREVVGDLANSSSDIHLVWDGHDLVLLDEWGEITSLVQRPGQRLIHLMAIPVGAWKEEVEVELRPVNVTALRRGDAKRAQRRVEAAAMLIDPSL
jgi:DNA-binding transcriptional MerR regulator